MKERLLGVSDATRSSRKEQIEKTRMKTGENENKSFRSQLGMLSYEEG